MVLRKKHKMTIDLEEIYIGALSRGCKLELIGNDMRHGKLRYFVEITEQNGVTYVVALWENE